MASVLVFPIPNGRASTMSGPTRLKVLSTHSATSSKLRGMLEARLLALGLQHQRKAYFHRIANPLGALPIALAHPKIQTIEFGGAREPGAARRVRELKVNRHILGDAVQGERAHRAEACGGLGNGLGDVMRRRHMRDVENILAAP